MNIDLKSTSIDVVAGLARCRVSIRSAQVMLSDSKLVHSRDI